MKKRNILKNVSFGSIIIGVLTLGLLGFSIYNLLVRLALINSAVGTQTLFIMIGGIFGLLAGFKYPITTEATSFAFTSLILVQAVWDSTYDIIGGFDDKRVIIGCIAIFIFALNIFTGRLKLKTAKKQIKRTLGAK